MGGQQHLAAELDGQRRRHAGSGSDQAGLDRLEHVQLFLGIVLQGARQRADEAVGGENPEEGTHQGGGDVVADLRLAAFAKQRHGDDDAEYRGDDTEARQGVGDLGHRVGRMLQVLLETGQFHVEQAFQLVRRHVAGGHDAQVVTDIGGHPLVLQHAGVLAEDGTGRGVLDVRLDRHHPFAPALVEDLVEHAQHLEVVGLGKAVAEHLRRFLQHHHERAARVGLEERPQCRATDDQDLEGLDDGADLAAGEQEAPEDTGENDDDADDF